MHDASLLLALFVEILSYYLSDNVKNKNGGDDDGIYRTKKQGNKATKVD